MAFVQKNSIFGCALWAGISMSAALVPSSSLSAQTITAVMQSPLRVLDPIVSSAALSNTHAHTLYHPLPPTDPHHTPHPHPAHHRHLSAPPNPHPSTLPPRPTSPHAPP